MSTTDANTLPAQPVPNRTARIAAWVTTTAFAAMMTLSGALFLVGPPPVIERFGELGYPLYFLKLLGFAKLLGVVGLLLPRRPTLREWAYAGFTFDLLAGAVSHVATGGASHVPGTLFALALLVSSYLLRQRAPAEARD